MSIFAIKADGVNLFFHGFSIVIVVSLVISCRAQNNSRTKDITAGQRTFSGEKHCFQGIFKLYEKMSR